jgi:hypothetical protein
VVLAVEEIVAVNFFVIVLVWSETEGNMSNRKEGLSGNKRQPHGAV